MLKTLPYVLIALVSGGAALSAAPSEARAEYCREYTRTVYIGNRVQDAYGTACYQPDGSWMIVNEGLGRDIPDNATNVEYVIHDGWRDYTPPRVIYHSSPQINIYRHRPAFVWHHDGHYRGDRHVRYVKHKHHRHKDWDRGHKHHRKDYYRKHRRDRDDD